MPPAWGSLLSRRAQIGAGRFADGVASGDPTPTAVTFWSRLRTKRARSGARLIVARDPDMRRVIATAVVPTGQAIGHTLKARLGGLKPATEYYYLWESASDVSPIGRTRTRPPKDSTGPLRIAFSSCQHYQAGWFSAHAHAATEALDLYLFLGDYIYEHGRSPLPTDFRVDTSDATDLRSYRHKYALARAIRGSASCTACTRRCTSGTTTRSRTTTATTCRRPRRCSARRATALRRSGFRASSTRATASGSTAELPINAMAELFLLDARQYRTGSQDGLPRRLLGDTQMAWLLARAQSIPRALEGDRPAGQRRRQPVRPWPGDRRLGRLPGGSRAPAR